MAKDANPAPDKTQLLGNGGSPRPEADMDEMVTNLRSVPSGRLVIVDGPGKGQKLQLFSGTNPIGREAGHNAVVLDFGDMKIHRKDHAFITCLGREYKLHENGKTNPVRVNGQPIQGVVVVTPADDIEIGATKLRIDLG
jgi:hypothetical protein